MRARHFIYTLLMDRSDRCSGSGSGSGNVLVGEAQEEPVMVPHVVIVMKEEEEHDMILAEVLIDEAHVERVLVRFCVRLWWNLLWFYVML